MQHLEAIELPQIQPKIWVSYVDDTLTIIKKGPSKLKEHQKHLKGIYLKYHILIYKWRQKKIMNLLLRFLFLKKTKLVVGRMTV